MRPIPEESVRYEIFIVTLTCSYWIWLSWKNTVCLAKDLSHFSSCLFLKSPDRIIRREALNSKCIIKIPTNVNTFLYSVVEGVLGLNSRNRGENTKRWLSVLDRYYIRERAGSRDIFTMKRVHLYRFIHHQGYFIMFYLQQGHPRGHLRCIFFFFFFQTRGHQGSTAPSAFHQWIYLASLHTVGCLNSSVK